MRINLLIVIVACLGLIGCGSLHYQNIKYIRGEGEDVRTKFGKIKNAKFSFRSSVDYYWPWKMKFEETVQEAKGVKK